MDMMSLHEVTVTSWTDMDLIEKNQKKKLNILS